MVLFTDGQGKPQTVTATTFDKVYRDPRRPARHTAARCTPGHQHCAAARPGSTRHYVTNAHMQQDPAWRRPGHPAPRIRAWRGCPRSSLVPRSESPTADCEKSAAGPLAMARSIDSHPPQRASPGFPESGPLNRSRPSRLRVSSCGGQGSGSRLAMRTRATTLDGMVQGFGR
jgi:hypothetical protein